MATPRAELKGKNPEQTTIKELEPGDFGVFDGGRIVYKPFGGGPAQAFDGGYFSGLVVNLPVRKLQKGEVVEITVK